MKKNREIKILFLDILTGDKTIRKEANKKVYKGRTYADIMRDALSLKKGELIPFDASENRFPENLSEFDGIVVGGSMVDPVPGMKKPQWVKQTYEFIKKAIKQRIPILGICGGLQFTVCALGGTVILNPKGREFGSIKATLTAGGRRDPIFKGLSKKITVASAHKCMAKNLKPGWRLLASSDLCKVQAIAIGDRVRLLQFHPEKNASMLKDMAHMRKSALLKEGFVKNEDEFEKFINAIENTEKAGGKILQNFLNYFVLSSRRTV